MLYPLEMSNSVGSTKVLKRKVISLFSSVAFLFVGISEAQIDENNDGLSDVWVQRYQVTDLVLGADTDNDGQSNFAENVAGTDPNDSQSVLSFTNIEFFPDSVLIKWKSVLGVRYQLESSETLLTGDWQPVGEIFIGNGKELIESTKKTSNRQFFRVNALSDFGQVTGDFVKMNTVDTDGDGKSDLEEIIAGLEPFDSSSSKQEVVVSFGDGVRLSWNSQKGKRYQIISSSVNGNNSIIEGDSLLGTGSIMSTTYVSNSNELRQLQLRAYDVDQDQD